MWKTALEGDTKRYIYRLIDWERKTQTDRQTAREREEETNYRLAEREIDKQRERSIAREREKETYSWTDIARERGNQNREREK